MKPRLLLHICCGPCSTEVIRRLKEDYEVVGFFYNPNIYPQEEYLLRLAAARRVAAELGFPLIEGDCRPEEWRAAVASLENEPEGGRRCQVCFNFRLERTYRLMLEPRRLARRYLLGNPAFIARTLLWRSLSHPLARRDGRRAGRSRAPSRRDRSDG